MGRKKKDGPNDLSEEQLARLFGQLGASEPESWAASQINEGIPQLARFLFLRQAWRGVVDENNPSWIEAAIQEADHHPDRPYAAVGHALKKLKALGAHDSDLVDLVRGMQAELLFSLCYLLGDPGDLEEEVAAISWALVQLDASGNIIGSIDALHESVLKTDPTGREMRPRG